MSAQQGRHEGYAEALAAAGMSVDRPSLEPLEHSIEVENPWGWRSPMVAADETGGKKECDEPQ